MNVSCLHRWRVLAAWCLLGSILCASPACRPSYAGGGHSHDAHGGHEADAHGHGHGAGTEAITRWGERAQLHAEIAPLVVGQARTFAAHLTTLATHRPVESGRVVVTLRGGGAPDERFVVEGPATPGIFTPQVKPAHAAKRAVSLALEGHPDAEVFELGTLTVFPDARAADAAPRQHPGVEGVSLTLEHQWRVPFRVEAVTEHEVRPGVPALARVVLPEDATVEIVAPRAGRVIARRGSALEVGDTVRSGAQLAALSVTPVAEVEPAALRLAVDRASIQVVAARREVDRLEPLLKQGVIPARRLDAARQALAIAEATQRSARQQRGAWSSSQRVQRGVAALSLPSPRDGVLAAWLATPGQWVERGQPIARVVSLDRVLLDVGVPEAYLDRLPKLAGVRVQLDAQQPPLELPRASLLHTAPSLDPKTRTLNARFRLPAEAPRDALVPGRTLSAELLTTSGRRALAVPRRAVLHDGGVPVVYAQRAGETFERVPVRLGAADGLRVEILDGLRAGDHVVTRGAYTVKLAATASQAIGHGHAH